MKILFLNPSFKLGRGPFLEQYLVRAGSRWPHTGTKLRFMRPHYLPFPFFLAIAAAVARRAGFEVAALDAVALDIDGETMLKAIAVCNPDLVVFEPAASSLDFDAGLCAAIKTRCTRRVRIALCGPFALSAGG